MGDTWRWYAAEYLPRLTDGERSRRRWEMYLDAELGALMPWEVTPAKVAAVLAKVPRGPRTVNAVRETLRALIHAAIANGRWPMGNPVSAVRPRKVPRRRWPTLSVAEARALLEHSREPYRSLWAVLLYLGLRRGEAYALAKGDVDQVARTLRVHKSHDRPSTKNGLERTLPIPRELWPTVARLLEGKTELLFPSPSGGLRCRREKLSERLRSDLARAGVVAGWEHRCRRCGTSERRPDASPTCCNTCGESRKAVAVPRALRAHDLRHTFTTLALEAGTDREVVRMTLGHAGDVTSIYRDVSLERQRKELERLSLAYPGVHGPECPACVNAVRMMDSMGLLTDEAPAEVAPSPSGKAEAPAAATAEASSVPVGHAGRPENLPSSSRNPESNRGPTDYEASPPSSAVAGIAAAIEQSGQLDANLRERKRLGRAIADSFGLTGKHLDLPTRGIRCGCGDLAAITLNGRPLCEACFNRSLVCEGKGGAR